MPQTTRSAPRPRARPRPGGRFARTTPTPGRFPRPTGRRPKQQSKGGLLAGLLSAGGASKSKSGSKSGRAGGFAALTAAAGLAFRNRDKLTAMFNRKRGGDSAAQQPDRPTPQT